MANEKSDQEWIDVSATISDGMVHWPSDPVVQVYKSKQIGVNKSVANVTAIATTAHVGTHVDAPLHFIADGGDVASLSLDKLIGPARVIHIHNNKEITLEEIEKCDIETGARVLFRTANSDTDWERQSFNENYVFLSLGAAQYLADKNVKCIGVDYLSIGGGDSNPAVHRLLLGRSILIIEGLKLGAVEEGEYDMICLPLKIKGSDGGPSRVILRKKTQD